MTHHPRVIQVSDTHLGASNSERELASLNAWRAFSHRVSADPPDLVVITGDLVLDQPDSANDRAFVHELITTAGFTVRVVPGNHDVGDHAVRGGLPADWHGAVVTDQRVQQWEEVWGASHWATELGAWDLIGLNAQVLGSGTAAESEQWEWLDEYARTRDERRHAIVFMHEPLAAPTAVDAAEPWMCVPSTAGEKLSRLFTRMNVDLIAAGHTHRFHQWVAAGLEQLTAPSLVSAIPVRDDMIQPVGDKAPGWVGFELCDAALGVRHITLTSDR